jgi:hypothetical protein
MVDNHRQQLPSLPFASPLANIHNGSGVATMLSRLKSTHAFKQEFFSGLDLTILTFRLPILPLTMELISLHLGLEQSKPGVWSCLSAVLLSMVYFMLLSYVY